jgi:hypothetical protein
MYYHKSGQVWATHPNTVARPTTCTDDVLKSSRNYRRGKQAEVNVNFMLPSLCGQQQNLLCLRDSGLRARYEDVTLHSRSANLLSYFSTVRKLNNFENLCRYMARVT